MICCKILSLLQPSHLYTLGGCCHFDACWLAVSIDTLSPTWIPTAVIFFWLLRPAKLKPLVLQMLASSMIPLSEARLQINQDIGIFCPQNATTRWSWAQTKANILGANQRQKTICSGHWYTPNLGTRRHCTDPHNIKISHCTESSGTRGPGFSFVSRLKICTKWPGCPSVAAWWRTRPN